MLNPKYVTITLAKYFFPRTADKATEQNSICSVRLHTIKLLRLTFGSPQTTTVMSSFDKSWRRVASITRCNHQSVVHPHYILALDRNHTVCSNSARSLAFLTASVTILT